MCPQQMRLVPQGLKREDDRLVSLPIIRCSLTIFFCILLFVTFKDSSKEKVKSTFFE